MALEQELETFSRELPALLANPDNREKYALVFKDNVEGIYSSQDDALAAGYDRFGIEPFLVKIVTEHEKPIYFSRNVSRCP